MDIKIRCRRVVKDEKNILQYYGSLRFKRKTEKKFGLLTAKIDVWIIKHRVSL